MVRKSELVLKNWPHNVRLFGKQVTHTNIVTHNHNYSHKMKKFQNYKSLKIRKDMSKKNSEMDKLLKVFNKTWNYNSINESPFSFSMGQEISFKNDEIIFLERLLLKSKYSQRA